MVEAAVILLGDIGPPLPAERKLNVHPIGVHIGDFVSVGDIAFLESHIVLKPKIGRSAGRIIGIGGRNSYDEQIARIRAEIGRIGVFGPAVGVEPIGEQRKPGQQPLIEGAGK